MWPIDSTWAQEAPLELVEHMPPIDLHAVESMDARITIAAPENIHEEDGLSPERRSAVMRAREPFLRRSREGTMPWVGCQFPCPALAQEAGMSTEAFADFLYGAVLRDWDALGRELRRYADRFDAADTVRILGEGTDISFSIRDRPAMIDEGRRNLPGGEFFFSPVEDATEGVIAFTEFAAEHRGMTVEGIRLRFEGGRVVEASAESGEAALLSALETDEGARVAGELGIGCNDAITRAMRNTLFDEKIAGTIHVALGASYAAGGGRNESALHWDIVKDLRSGGRIELDGELVQENGKWLI
jgi:aminopeptidase